MILLQRFKTLTGRQNSSHIKLLGVGGGSVAFKLANIALGLLLSIALARGLEPEGYGIYTFAFAFASLLAIPVQLGLPALLVREVSRYHYREKWGLMRGLFRRSSQIAVMLTLVVVPLSAGTAWLLLAGSEDSTLQLATFFWALALIPLIALGNLRGAALRGLGEFIWGQLPEIVIRPGLLMLLVGIAWYGNVLTPVSAMALNVMAAGIAFFIGLWLLRQFMPTPVGHARPSYDTAAWVRSLLPLSLMSAAKIVFDHTDLVMLGFLGTLEGLGLYRIALQGSNLVAFGLIAVNMVLAPLFARLYEAGDIAELQKLVTQSAQAIFALTLPVGLGFILLGEWILELIFGAAYAKSALSLSILSAAQLLSTFLGSVGLLLIMSGHERAALHNQVAAMCLNIILNGILIPVYGIEGAASATAVSVVAWNILLWRSVRHHMGIESSAIGPWRERIKDTSKS